MQSLDDVLKEESSEPAKNQNPSETPQPLLPVDDNEDEDLASDHEKKNDDVGVALHSENKTDTKVQFSSPGTGDENGKKRKTWLLSDSQVIIDYVNYYIWLKRTDLSE